LKVVAKIIYYLIAWVLAILALLGISSAL